MLDLPEEGRLLVVRELHRLQSGSQVLAQVGLLLQSQSAVRYLATLAWSIERLRLRR